MSIGGSLSERAKYTYMLHLCREQIRVVSMGDMLALDRIMLAKKAIIESLNDPQSLMRNDPSVITIIEQIKQAEIESQSALQERMNVVKKKLTEVTKQQGARRAYRRYPASTHRMGFTVDQYTPRFIDRAS